MRYEVEVVYDDGSTRCREFRYHVSAVRFAEAMQDEGGVKRVFVWERVA